MNTRTISSLPNPFNQSLNTTNSPTFNALTISTNLQADQITYAGFGGVPANAALFVNNLKESSGLVLNAGQVLIGPTS